MRTPVTSILTSVIPALLALATLAGCDADDGSGTTPTSSAPVTASTSSPSSSTTTTTLDPSQLRDEGPLAAALDDSLVTEAELSATARTVSNPSPVGDTVPEGPLSPDGLVAAFGDIYRDPLTKARAQAGARRMLALELSGSVPAALEVVAVRFATAKGADTFDSAHHAIATQVGGAQRTEVGAVTVVRRLPTADRNEVVGGRLLYGATTAYYVALEGAPGTITDDALLAVLAAQDSRLQAEAARLGL